MARGKKKEDNVSFQTTSLVDVLFILLVFFIMVSQVKTSSVRVKLPEIEGDQSTAPPRDKKGQTITITLDQNSKLFLGNKLITMEKLKRNLAEIWRKEGKESSVIIRADNVSKSGQLVNVLNCVNEVGFKQINIATKGK